MSECLGAECESREVTVAPSDLVGTTTARASIVCSETIRAPYTRSANWNKKVSERVVN